MVNLRKNNRGQVLVLVAISLIVILGLAALAIDIGYFYHTKNQLQGAADAAALAGAVKLDGTNNLFQTAPRQEAIKYAALNNAAGSPVQLSDDNSNSLSGNSNDIALGSWISNTFTPGGTPVNAVKVRTRRTSESPGSGIPRLFGKIFDTTNQDISAEAIAERPARSSSYIYFCDSACTSCISSMCTLSSPRVISTDTNLPEEKQFAWTSLTAPVTSASEVSDYICADPPFVDNCNIPIYSTNGGPGSVIRDLEARMYDPAYESNMKEKDALGKITGWWVIVPVISPCPPGKQPAPQTVTYYANIRIKAICSSSSSSPACGGQKLKYNSKDDGPANVCKNIPNNSIIIDSIQCSSCGSPDQWPGYKSVLVQ